MVYEKRYNDIIDRMLAEERREAMAFQRAIYPAVALYVSTFIVVVLKLNFFGGSEILGRIIIVSLFIVGVIHLVSRIREGFENFTSRDDDDIHDSILDDNDRPKPKPYSRVGAVAALTGGFLLCLLLGYLVGTRVNLADGLITQTFSRDLKPEIIFYPPIIVFFVDIMHSLASRFER